MLKKDNSHIVQRINSKNKNQETIKVAVVEEQKLEEALWRNK